MSFKYLKMRFIISGILWVIVVLGYMIYDFAR